jgi:hypothetical protein
MRYLKRLAWAAVVIGVTAATGSAQQGSVITSGGQTVGGNLNTNNLGGITGNQGGGGLGGGGQGGGGQGGLGGSQLQGTQLQGMEAAPDISAPTGTTGGTGAASSNIFGAYYANPYFSGTWANSKSGAAPGGFGAAMYPSTGGTGGTGGRGGLGSQRGGQGGLGGLGGQAGRQNGTNNNYGTIVPMPVQIAYAAVPGPEFRIAPMAAPQVQADVSGMFSRAVTTVPGAANVQVITNGNEVTLRGIVRDVEEARLIEGMTRLTPGVGRINNELTFPISRP